MGLNVLLLMPAFRRLQKALPSRDGTPMRARHGWQPAVMTGMMWMANVVGEFLAKVNEDVQVRPLRRGQ